MKRSFALLLLGVVGLLAGGGQFFAQKDDKQPQKAIPLALSDGKATASDKLTRDDPTDTVRTGCHRKTYAVDLVKGHNYRLDMTSKEFDVYVRLEDSGGKALAQDDDSGGERNARINFACPATGTYRLVATAYASGSQGAYTLTVVDLASSGTIALDLKDGKSQVKGELRQEDARDAVKTHQCKTYTVRFEVHAQYQIDLSSDAVDAFLRLEDPTGKQLAMDDDGGGGRSARIRFTCPTTGVYRVIATSHSGGVGAFVLSVLQTSPGKTSLTLKEGKARVDGVLNSQDVRDHADPKQICKHYEVRLEAGQKYRLDMSSAAFDAYLRLEDSAGKELAKDDDSGNNRNARITFACPTTDNYRLVATTTGSLGAFTLTVESLSPPGPKMLRFEARDEGTLTQESPKDKGDPYRAYSIRFETGRVYRIDMTSKAIDSHLRLEGPDGKELAQDDSSGGGLDARITHLCRVTGTYRIVASSKARLGSYTLVIGQQDAAKPVPLSLKDGSGRVEARLTDEDAADHVTQAGHCKVYAVQLEAGQVYRIEQASKEFASVLRIEDSAGKDLVKEDKAVEPSCQVTYLCRRSGTYHLVATGCKLAPNDKGPDGRTATGAFVLTVERQEAFRASEIDLKNNGAKTDGQLTKDGLRDPLGGARPVRVYLVRLDASKTYRFDLASRQFDGYLRLENEDGEVVTEDDDGGGGLDARLTYRPARTGTYFLVATTYATPVKVGAFTLAVQQE